MHNFSVPWVVLFHDAFDKEFSNLKEGLQDELFWRKPTPILQTLDQRR